MTAGIAAAVTAAPAEPPPVGKLLVASETDADFYDSLREKLAQPGRPIASPSGVQQAALRRRALLGVARNAVAVDDRQRALAAFEQVVEEFPGDADAGFERAGALMRWGVWEVAEKQLRQLLALDPREERLDEYAMALADVLWQQQRRDEATEVLAERVAGREHTAMLRLRLGRLYAWQEDWGEADRAVGGLADRDVGLTTRETRELAAYFVESGRPERALATLDRVSVESEEAFADAALRVRALAELGDESAAATHLAGLGATANQGDQRERFDLGDALYRSGHNREALAVYQQVAGGQLERRGAIDPALRAKIVRTQVRLLDLPAAGATLGPAQPGEDAELLAARANYLTVAGRHADAERVCRQLLALDPTDPDHRNAYGHLYYSIGDYLRAESEYRQSLCLAPRSLKTLPYVARAMMHSQKHAEAVGMLRGQMTDPRRVRSLRPVLIEVLLDAWFAGEAEHECRLGLADARTPRHRAWMRTQLGWSMLLGGDAIGAVAELEAVLAEAGPQDARLVYGLSKAYRRCGRQAEAEALIGAFESAVGDDPVARMALADLGTADCRGRFAERVLTPALRASPDNVALLNRLGEAAALEDRQRRTRRDRWFFRRTLELSPGNTRARLGLARSYARTHQPSRSLATYVALINDLPSHRLATSERSRVTYGALGPDAGVAEFARSQSRLVGDRASNLVAAAQAAEAVARDANDLEQSLLSLERCAKRAKPHRPTRSIGTYQTLIDLDRINEEARFDLAQVYGSLNRTREAACEFTRLLEVNPCHSEAEWALARTQYERGPQWWSSVGWEDLNGRDGLTDISRTRLETFGRLPTGWLGGPGDEDEYAYAGYAHEFLVDGLSQITNGDHFLFGGAVKPRWDTRLFADLQIAAYDRGFDTRPTGRVGVQRYTSNDVQWTLAGFLNNVDDNSESITQDIHRTGAEVSFTTKPHWRRTLSGGYRWSDYSDGNHAHEGWLIGEHLLHDGCGRCQWRLLADAYYFDFAEQTEFVGPTGDLAGAIHPYFSPNGFLFTTVGLEYKRWLSPGTHKYANHWWWSAYAGGRVDNEGIGYGVGRLRFRRDHRPWLTTGADIETVQSEVFDSVAARVYLIARWR